MTFEARGYVVGNDDKGVMDWFGIDSFCPRDLQAAIDDTPEGEELVININSPGGSMFAGFEMYSKLMLCGKPTRGIVQSIAASAASTMLMGCRTRQVTPVGQVMVHRCAADAEGLNEAEARKMAKDLRSFDISIVNAYMAACGGKSSRSAIQQMMEKETFLHPQLALEAGLIDEIIVDHGAPTDPMTVTNAAGGFDLAALRERYRKEKNDAAEDIRLAAERQRLIRNQLGGI